MSVVCKNNELKTVHLYVRDSVEYLNEIKFFKDFHSF